MPKTVERIHLKRVLSGSYRERGYEPIPPIRLEDAEYGRGLQRFVPVCTDIIIVDKKRRLFLLPRRTAKPWAEIAWIGGSIMAHETPAEGAVNIFRRETSLSLEETRLTLVAINDYRWKDREQSPPMACHTDSYLFVVELSEDDLEKLTLDPKEYDQDFGIRSFDREQLVAAEVHPATLDAYDALFPPE